MIWDEHQHQLRTQNMTKLAQYSCSLSPALTQLWTNLEVERLKQIKTPVHVNPFHFSFLRSSPLLCSSHSSLMCSSLTWLSGYVLSLLYSSTVGFCMLLSFVCISGLVLSALGLCVSGSSSVVFPPDLCVSVSAC